MPVSVPTIEEFNALSTRVDELAAQIGNPVIKESAEGTVVNTVGPAIMDAAGNLLTITTDKRIGINGLADPLTANVVQMVYTNHKMVHENTAHNWYRLDLTGTVSAYTQVPSPIAVPPPSGHFTVTTAGFVGPSGKPFSAKGINSSPGEFLSAWANMKNNLPGMTFLRLVCDSTYSDSRFTPAQEDQAIATATGAGIVVAFEDHNGTPNASWYTMMIGKHKNNPLCFLELWNEPNDANLATQQITMINMVRDAGWTNPIGLMSYAGWKPDVNFPKVLAAVGTKQIYGVIHIYGWGTGSQHAIEDIAATYKIYPFCDEFGGSVAGGPTDAQAVETITTVISTQQAGKCGAAFWYLYNPTASDSVYTDATGATFTSWGTNYVKPWLSGIRPTP